MWIAEGLLVLGKEEQARYKSEEDKISRVQVKEEKKRRHEGNRRKK